ncbi:hypothetical protein [Spongiactinospora sp. TRM90649]|uniref:hypothetical protein n=1 Tax=Spongiactinospora sp. TRM90649 TaxID=3031114 RepID=UPI0023F9EB47|nr:hypothetical protein [Spongiactinospora sp. TRM90649]MDF5759188.1 hypothetical protein [Spongiactinospora sp. TRM90649]
MTATTGDQDAYWAEAFPERPGPSEAEIEERTRREDALYRSEAAIGRPGIDAAITTALADIHAAIRNREQMRSQDASAYAITCATRHVQGLTIGLGRLLALRDGISAEHAVTAFYRGRTHASVQ